MISDIFPELDRSEHDALRRSAEVLKDAADSVSIAELPAILTPASLLQTRLAEIEMRH